MSNSRQSELREAMAEQAHRSWSDWMDWLFKLSETNPDGSVTIHEGAVKRWRRQIETPYSELSEREKEADRKEADAYLAIIERFSERC